MEFQVLTASVEDHLPRGLPAEVRRRDLLYKDFHCEVRAERAEKRLSGAVALCLLYTSPSPRDS